MLTQRWEVIHYIAYTASRIVSLVGRCFSAFVGGASGKYSSRATHQANVSIWCPMFRRFDGRCNNITIPPYMNQPGVGVCCYLPHTVAAHIPGSFFGVVRYFDSTNHVRLLSTIYCAIMCIALVVNGAIGAKDLIDLSEEPARKRKRGRSAEGTAAGPCRR